MPLSGGSTFAALTVLAGGTLDIYNTADQTTNYERLRADFTSNVAQLYTQQAGTGAARSIRLGTSSSGVISRYLEVNASGSASALATVFQTAQGSSGTQAFLRIGVTAAQSGTAGYTGIDVDVTETTTGSGTKLLQRWAVGGAVQGSMTSSGILSSVNFTATSSMGLGASLGALADVLLRRDAADTLALRNSTAAQTFRVYNTYTDASNYERANHYWSGNVYYIQTSGAGTGVARHITISNTATGSALNFGTNLNFTTHLLASADNTYDIGASGANRPRNVYAAGSISGNSVSAGSIYSSTYLELFDGITAPGSTANRVRLYVDAADGDLKIVFSDGTVKTIVTDT